jgi:two-component sensor histidine kinase/CheY-like chemotaxis protein
MEKELRILILEDVQYDAELIEYELRHEEIKFISYRVETEIDFTRELENFKPDIILVDHSLPTFDGISALEITKKKCPEIPFIFVSGKIGDEFAVDMLKKGATDYVFKNNLTKLVPAIKRALMERNELEELKRSKKQLQKALDEKEMLLKEIHHRVKNNLMTISSLLELQSHYIKDKTDFDFFRESKNRADSMALIHERLYQSNDLKRIDFDNYIHTLAIDLFNAYVTDQDWIKLIVNVEDIMLDINTAIPLGLIITELVTNSLKYAFPVAESYGNHYGSSKTYKKKDNLISIDFSKKNSEFMLIIKDNGIGFPKGLDYKNNDSLGLELVISLTRQINGNISLDNGGGTEFRITFKELEYNGSV